VTFFYDDLTDVMHIAFEQTAGPCLYVEAPSGSILRIERATNKLVSIVIPAFLAQVNENALVLPELAAASLPPDFLNKFLSTK
jgi:hypothetical protein